MPQGHPQSHQARRCRVQSVDLGAMASFPVGGHILAEAAQGENCLLGAAIEDEYRTLTASAQAYGHKLISLAPCDINKAKQKLFEARSERIRPLTDDKILTSWNGLALTALCRGYQISGDKKYLEAARQNAVFTFEPCRIDKPPVRLHEHNMYISQLF